MMETMAAGKPNKKARMHVSICQRMDGTYSVSVIDYEKGIVPCNTKCCDFSEVERIVQGLEPGLLDRNLRSIQAAARAMCEMAKNTPTQHHGLGSLPGFSEAHAASQYANDLERAVRAKRELNSPSGFNGNYYRGY